MFYIWICTTFFHPAFTRSYFVLIKNLRVTPKTLIIYSVPQTHKEGASKVTWIKSGKSRTVGAWPITSLGTTYTKMDTKTSSLVMDLIFLSTHPDTPYISTFKHTTELWSRRITPSVRLCAGTHYLLSAQDLLAPLCRWKVQTVLFSVCETYGLLYYVGNRSIQ